MNFATKYNRVRFTPEINSGEDLAERAGYIPAKTRIENLLFAGQRLSQARKEMYDFPDGKVDPTFSDPTRLGNFDLADAFALNESLKEKKKKADANQVLKAQEDTLKASQTALEAPGEA